MSGPATASVGFIGLGQMGAAMAARVAAAGFALTVLDARSAITEAFTEQHAARGAASPAALAEGCDVLITMLPDGIVVRDVLTRPAHDGGPTVLDVLRPGTTIIDMSSSAPHDTLALGELLGEHEIALIDAPVSGGVRRALDGSLAIMAGGPHAIIDRHEPLLLAMGDTIFRTGALGTGHAAKALNNAVSAAGLIAAGEAIVIGDRFGIEPEVLLAVLNASTGRNNATENKIAQFVLSRTYASGFSLDFLAKDLRIADDLARSVGAPHALAEVSRAVLDQASAWLGRDGDHTEVVAFLEHQAVTRMDAAL